MVVSARGEEGHAAAFAPSGLPQAEQVAVEPDRSVEVADEEGDVAQLGHPHDVSHQYKHRPGWAPP